jgi:ribosomal protein S2
MGELVNLNKVRKERAKAGAKAAAKTSRAAHGQSKAERTAAERERARIQRLLDGSKLED